MSNCNSVMVSLSCRFSFMADSSSRTTGGLRARAARWNQFMLVHDPKVEAQRIRGRHYVHASSETRPSIARCHLQRPKNEPGLRIASDAQLSAERFILYQNDHAVR